MCRVYKPRGKDPYIRLCSYFGEAKGQRIPEAGVFWVDSGRHVAKLRWPGSIGPPRPNRNHRCRKCNAPLNRDLSRGALCYLCLGG